jgi:DNA-binding NarL/FixJ family response regulator
MKGAMELVCANPVEATRLRRASGGFTYLLHTGFAERAGETLESFGGAHRSKNPTSGPGLSNRELEVLHLIAKGKTNKDIGSVLGISARTVQVHASRAYDKIGACNRAGATSWLAEHRGRLD